MHCQTPQVPKRDCTLLFNPNPDPINFPNDIILNALDNTAVLTINFNSSNNKITVNSTGKITDSAGQSNYFKFILYDSDGTTEKINTNIGGN